MSTPNVFCDVSFAAYQHERGGATTGVGRVIDHLVQCLIQEDKVDVHFLGAFADDPSPLNTDHSVRLWAQQRQRLLAKVMSPFHSRTGLYPLLAKPRYAIAKRLGAFRETPTTLKQRAAAKVLTCLEAGIKWDARIDWQRIAGGMFLSTYWPPPATLPPQVPRVAILYDLYPLERPDECAPELVKMMQRLATSLHAQRDWAVAISDYTRQVFCRVTGFPVERVLVGHLAAEPSFAPVKSDDELSAVRQRYAIGKNRYVLMVSNPQPRKNLEGGVLAFLELIQTNDYQDLKLVMVGNRKVGWESEQVDRLIESKPQLAKKIIYIDAVPDRDMAAIYSAASVFLFPSFYEGFGLPPLEAMQCGVPVVCSHATSLPEVVGKAALLVDPDSPNAMADAMRSFLSDPLLTNRYREMGIDRARYFSWTQFAEAVVSAIHSAWSCVNA